MIEFNLIAIREMDHLHLPHTKQFDKYFWNIDQNGECLRHRSKRKSKTIQREREKTTMNLTAVME